MTKKTEKHETPISEQADTTNHLVADDSGVSRTEHSMGSRQPDDGTYDAMRAKPPLAGRDVPQKIVTAVNHTPTPGEDNAPVEHTTKHK